MTPEERKLAKEHYLKALEDPASGITLDTPAGMIEGTVQKRFGDAAAAGVAAANKLTHSQALAQVRLNSGYVVTGIHLLSKPGTRRTVQGTKKPSR